MACSCKNIVIENNIGFGSTYIVETLPFQTCPLCAFKHLSYALIKFDQNKFRAIANIYLAYKHLQKGFDIEANKCFDLIIKYFQNFEIDKTQLLNIVNLVHEASQNQIQNQNKNQDHHILNLEKNLKQYQFAIIKILAANQLFNFEVGYKDINTPYVIGLLQQSTQLFENNQIIRNKIRKIWKDVQTYKKFDSSQILNFVEQLLYRQQKDNLLSK